MNNPWLSIPPLSTNLNVLRVDGESAIDAFWAVDAEKNFLFLVEGLLPDPAVALPEIDAIQSAVVPDRNRVRLLFRLRDATDWELFFALCSDLARTLRVTGVESGLAAVARRLVKWRDFLRATRRRLLSEERIRGLLAELRFLERSIAPRFGWRAAVAAWAGPLGMPQDFSTGGTVVEVKAKLNTARRRVRISSAAQLDVPTGRVLFLHVSTFGIAGEDDGKYPPCRSFKT